MQKTTKNKDNEKSKKHTPEDKNSKNKKSTKQSKETEYKAVYTKADLDYLDEMGF